MKRYGFLPKNCSYSFDVWAKNEKEARAWIRKFLDKKNLRGVCVWLEQ